MFRLGSGPFRGLALRHPADALFNDIREASEDRPNESVRPRRAVEGQDLIEFGSNTPDGTHIHDLVEVTATKTGMKLVSGTRVWERIYGVGPILIEERGNFCRIVLIELRQDEGVVQNPVTCLEIDWRRRCPNTEDSRRAPLDEHAAEAGDVV